MAWTPGTGARAAVRRLGRDEAIAQMCELLRGEVDETELLRPPWPALLLEIGDIDASWVTGRGRGRRDHWPRAWAARAMSYVGDETAVPTLVAATRDPHWRVRMNSVQALGKIGAVAAEPAVMKAGRDVHPRVRAAGSTALARIAGPGAEASLALLLDDPDPRVRTRARSALESLVSGV